MKGSLPKVLMLGWEFPPLINGGLGVACHDLSNALSHLADVTMVVPKTSLDFKMKRVQLIGVNHLDAATLVDLPSNYHRPLPFKLLSVPVELDPYYSEKISGEAGGFWDAKSSIEAFNIDNLYGGDVIKKVFQFAELSTALSTKVNFDVIHAHDWMTMLAGVKIKQLTGKPLVMHIHSLEVDRSGEDSKGWVYDMEKKGMEYADLLMPVSDFTANNIQQHYGISKSKMSVVHNGSCEVNAYQGRRNTKEKTVLFVGRLTRQKGPEKFVDIAARVLEKNPDVRFVMAGTGDNFRSVLEKSSYRQLGHRFHLTGFLNSEQLRKLFSVSDVYCMPSVSEPFGLSAVEAAQFGIPCVISKQSGVSEVLAGSLRFDHWDVDKAATCILNLLSDEVLRKKVVKDASSNLKNITWDLSAQKIVKAYSLNNLI
jgi:glycogen synthase